MEADQIVNGGVLGVGFERVGHARKVGHAQSCACGVWP
jgi:hypothetical protein